MKFLKTLLILFLLTSSLYAQRISVKQVKGLVDSLAHKVTEIVVKQLIHDSLLVFTPSGIAVDTTKIATRYWVNAEGFLKTYLETDPGWVSDSSNYYKKTVVNGLLGNKLTIADTSAFARKLYTYSKHVVDSLLNTKVAYSDSTIKYLTLKQLFDKAYLDANSSLNPAKVNQTSSYRFTTDAEKSTWNSGTKILTANRTVNLTSSMSATTIQDSINAQPKNLGGYILTFQFADGTYTLNSVLTFKGFYSGQVNIRGNTSESSSKHTTQAVILNFASGAYGFEIYGCTAIVDVRYLKVYLDTSTTYAIGFHVTACARFISVANYLLGNSTVQGQAFNINSTFTTIQESYLNNWQSGICNYLGTVYSNSNAETGTNCTLGLYASEGGTIGINGTQPSVQSYDKGGIIR